MATDSIMGLFATPEQYQQQRNDAALTRGIQLAQLTPVQQGAALTYAAGNRLGGAIGSALGAEDPALVAASLRKQLAQGKDLTTAAGWGEYAKELQAQGDLQGAVQAAQKSSQLQIQIDEKRAAQEARTATEMAKIEANKSIAQQREENKMAIARMEASMRGGLSGVQQQIAEEKLNALKEKRTALEEAQQTKLSSSISTADNIISVAKEAIPLVSGWTTGTTGQVTGMKAGSNAYVLQSKIDTIKAQLGFAQLQQMRDASPTGGALGQVAVQELNYLQAALTNLDRAVGEKELKANLEKVVKHYTNWREAVTAKQAAKAPAGSGAGNNNDPLGIRR